MTQHELLLEQMIKLLILQPEDSGELGVIVSKVQEAWLRRLKSIFPQLCIKLGKRCDEVLLEYLRQNPPRSWNLQSFGSELPMYLKSWGQAKSDRYLPELADFEWSLYWVENMPSEAGSVGHYILNPFVRYLRFKYAIHEWWKTKKNTPKLNPELIVVSKDKKGAVLVFEPTLLEAAMIDTLGEMSLSTDQLFTAISATLPGTQTIQVEVALHSLIEKGVVKGRRVS